MMRELNPTKIHKIGFELEGKFTHASVDGGREITDFIETINADRPWISTHWHTDSLCSKEFKTHPISLNDDPFGKLKEFHELCKEKWQDYDLKSVHCHVSFDDISHQFIYRMIDGLMPLAVVFRAVKQNSLLDAWSQFFNCFSLGSRGMMRTRHYHRGHEDLNGMELRFAGKHYWIYEDIIKAIGKIKTNVSNWYLTRHKNNRFFQYPDNIKTLLEHNDGKTYDVSLAILKDIDAPLDIKKLFYREAQRRRGGAIILSYLFPWVLKCWRDYLPETCRYIDDELLPNLSDKLKYQIRSLRRNKYKLPFIRAWKNMLKPIGKIGVRRDLNNALEKFSNLSPLSEVEIKMITQDMFAHKIQRCYIPQIETGCLPSISASGLGEVKFQFNCPSIEIIGVTEPKDGIKFNCDSIIQGCGNTCCLYCSGDSARPEYTCGKRCKVDDLRKDRMLPRNPYISGVTFPHNIQFDTCHNCTNKCSKCKCLTCDKMGTGNCWSCSRLNIQTIVANTMLSKSMMKGDCSFTSTSSYLAFSMIMNHCDKLVFHSDFLFAKCMEEHGCELQGCCYVCRDYDKCIFVNRCIILGDKDEFYEDRVFKPNIINPNMPIEVRLAKNQRYQHLADSSDSALIYSKLEEIRKHMGSFNPVWDKCHNCPKWFIAGSKDCMACEYLNPYRCRGCISKGMYSTTPTVNNKYCSICERNAAYWLYWHKKHKIFMPYSIDEFIMKGKDDQVEWDAPEQHIRPIPPAVSFVSSTASDTFTDYWRR